MPTAARTDSSRSAGSGGADDAVNAVLGRPESNRGICRRKEAQREPASLSYEAAQGKIRKDAYGRYTWRSLICG